MLTSPKLLAVLMLLLCCARANGQFEAPPRTPRTAGDTISRGGTRLTVRDTLNPLAKPVPEIDIPIGGGTSRLRISDMNKALPQDRVYFTFNHFHNALKVDTDQTQRSFDVNRYSIGFEKTLFSDFFSVELRVPFLGTYEFFNDDFGVQGSNAGNLSIVTKQLIARNERGSSVVGLGLNLPTGTDVSGYAQDIAYTNVNEAIHFVPYWAYMATDDRNFIHLFSSWDFVATGNPIYATPPGSQRVQLGTITEQSLFSFDVSVGRWHYRNDQAPLLTGIASLWELHYITTLQDADQVGNVIDTTLLEFNNGRNRSDVLNFTVGLHFELNRDTAFRIGGVVPLREDPDRDFDAEVLAQLVHNFGATQTRERPTREPILGTYNPFERVIDLILLRGLRSKGKHQCRCDHCRSRECNCCGRARPKQPCENCCTTCGCASQRRVSQRRVSCTNQ